MNLAHVSQFSQFTYWTAVIQLIFFCRRNIFQSSTPRLNVIVNLHVKTVMLFGGHMFPRTIQSLSAQYVGIVTKLLNAGMSMAMQILNVAVAWSLRAVTISTNGPQLNAPDVVS